MRGFTPKESEARIATYLNLMAHLESLPPDSCKVTPGEVIERPEGTFEFDVTIRFRAFGVDYLTLGNANTTSQGVGFRAPRCNYFTITCGSWVPTRESSFRPPAFSGVLSRTRRSAESR